MEYVPTYPHKLTFAILPQDAPNPTFIIRRKGGVKVVRPYDREGEAFALIRNGGDEGKDLSTTYAQRRSVQQLCRVMLHNYALLEITFKTGTSPWMEDVLYQAHPSALFYDLMWEPHISFRKYFLFLRPWHPVIREKRFPAAGN